MATQLRCGASDGTVSLVTTLRLILYKILKIREYLANIWTKICVLLF